MARQLIHADVAIQLIRAIVHVFILPCPPAKLEVNLAVGGIWVRLAHVAPTVVPHDILGIVEVCPVWWRLLGVDVLRVH